MIPLINKMPTLASLIATLPKERKRTKKSSSSRVLYEYVTPAERDGVTNRIKVCHKAFISIFGITNRKTPTIKLSPATMGMHFFYFIALKC